MTIGARGGPYRKAHPADGPTIEEFNHLKRSKAFRNGLGATVGYCVWPSIVLGVILIISLLYASIDSPWTAQKKRRASFHDAQASCMPGWIEKLSGKTGYLYSSPDLDPRYQWDANSGLVICTDGEKRWTVNQLVEPDTGEE